MAKQVINTELERIIQAISRYPEGVGIVQILETNTVGLPQRTLQYHPNHTF